jgi:hypothetical protein
MLANDSICAQISKEQLIKIRVSRVLSSDASANLSPDLAPRDAVTIVNSTYHLKVHFRVLADPIDEHPNHVVAR